MKNSKVLIAIILVFSFLPLNATFAAEKTIDNYIPMDITEDHWAYEGVIVSQRSK